MDGDEKARDDPWCGPLSRGTVVPSSFLAVSRPGIAIATIF
jgi:hypothetical protein